MPIDTRTPEAAHSDVVAALEYELDTYGPQSLAEMAATLMEDRYDEDAMTAQGAYWRQCAEAFHRLADQLPGHRRA